VCVCVCVCLCALCMCACVCVFVRTLCVFVCVYVHVERNRKHATAPVASLQLSSNVVTNIFLISVIRFYSGSAITAGIKSDIDRIYF